MNREALNLWFFLFSIEIKYFILTLIFQLIGNGDHVLEGIFEFDHKLVFGIDGACESSIGENLGFFSNASQEIFPISNFLGLNKKISIFIVDKMGRGVFYGKGGFIIGSEHQFDWVDFIVQLVAQFVSSIYLLRGRVYNLELFCDRFAHFCNKLGELDHRLFGAVQDQFIPYFT